MFAAIPLYGYIWTLDLMYVPDGDIGTRLHATKIYKSRVPAASARIVEGRLPSNNGTISCWGYKELRCAVFCGLGSSAMVVSSQM